MFGDVHGNLEALEAVVADAKRQGVDRYVCVGDIVGYGASASECVDRVQSLTTQVVAGNHDCAVVGRTDLEYFNLFARDAVIWTRTHLSPADKAFLRDLPLTRVVDELLLVHATVHHPEYFGYIESEYSARLSFEAMEGDLAFVGHSHVPVAFVYDKEKKQISYSSGADLAKDADWALDGASKAILNVGSVGQPRDEDPRSSYMVYDSQQRTVTLRRISYDIETAKRKIVAAGLPEVLGVRLQFGR